MWPLQVPTCSVYLRVWYVYYCLPLTIAYLCVDNFLGSLLVDVPSTEQVSMKIIVQTYFWASMLVFFALSGKVLWEGLVCKPSTLKQTIKYNPFTGDLPESGDFPSSYGKLPDAMRL